jgi:hypothetical protein
LKASGPHSLSVKSFRKLPVSPVYGISQAEIDAGVDVELEGTDVGGLRLREYQVLASSTILSVLLQS